MDVQMRDEPGTDETPREDEEVREAHHDAVAVPFTPTPTRPGMNPRATPWTPSTPRVRFPAFSSVGAPHEHGTPHPGTPQTPHPRVIRLVQNSLEHRSHSAERSVCRLRRVAEPPCAANE